MLKKIIGKNIFFRPKMDVNDYKGGCGLADTTRAKTHS